MRYLKPKGTPIEIEGQIYYLKFTLDAIDEIQDKTNMPMHEVIRSLTTKKTQAITVKVLLKYLIGQEIEINEKELGYYSLKLIDTYIEQLKYKGMPEPKTKTVDENEEAPFIDVEYWFYIGKVVLGLPSDEVWQMTLGQIKTLEREHYKHIGLIKEDKEVNIDDVIPI